MEQLSPEHRESIIDCVIEAGKKLLHFWPGGDPAKKTGLGIQTKADGSFVTEADLTSNALIVSTLKRLFPADGILSEELPLASDLDQKRRVWVLDPLDGTHPFIDGQQDFSILLALCLQGRPIFSLMYFPARELLFSATKGQGAFLGEKPLRVSDARQFRPNSIRFRGNSLAPAPYLTDSTIDSGPSIVRLVNAELDGVVLRTGKMGEWDIAAPSLIVEESGGVVSDELGKPIYFGRGSIGFNYFVASNGHLHEQVLALASAQGSQV